MKKVLLLAVVALFVMMPFASFAMTTISDSDLNAITAQEGVSIYLNNITLSGINATMSWGQSSSSSLDPTGTTKIGTLPFDQGGFVGAVVSSTGNITVNGLLTIDVGVNNTTTLASTGIPGGIALGLKNMAIGVGGVQMIVKVGAEQSLTVPTLTMTMGTAFISNVTTTVNGQVLISTH